MKFKVLKIVVASVLVKNGFAPLRSLVPWFRYLRIRHWLHCCETWGKKVIHGKLNHTFLSEISEREGKLRPQVPFWYFKFSLVCVYPGKLRQDLVQSRHAKGEHFLYKKGKIGV